MREQTMAFLALAFLGVGVAMTGFLPTIYGLYFSTIIMSIGFPLLRDSQPVTLPAMAAQGQGSSHDGAHPCGRSFSPTGRLWGDLHHLENAAPYPMRPCS